MAAILLYSLTLMTSAALLFAVQPMIGKAVLPALGGTPATWSVCMLFFQCLLLFAYGYAHLVVTYFPFRIQLAIHSILLAAALYYQLDVDSIAQPGENVAPELFLLLWLLKSAGVAYFAISTTAPLLQSWFSKTRDTGDPYFLYAASNAGSLIGLLSYPFIVEPSLELSQQEATWGAGFILFIALIVSCGAYSALHFAQKADLREKSNLITTPGASKKMWVALAFVPSSLLLAATNHITTNISPVPLFWVVPLALYLLSFILAFSKFENKLQRYLRRYFALIVIPYAPLIFVSGSSELFLISFQLVLMFAVCLYCHTELSSLRPSPSRLTEYYLFMSLGGMLGGLFNALVAPRIFNSAPEYPLMLGAAVLLWALSVSASNSKRKSYGQLAVVALVAVLSLIISARARFPFSLELLFSYGIPAIAAFSLRRKPFQFATAFAILLLVLGETQRVGEGDLLFSGRNFFGVKEVRFDRGSDTQQLVHGVIVHGIQNRDSSKQSEPLSYFHRKGPVGDIFGVINNTEYKRSVGIIGLGIGAMAAYAADGDRFTFYEIDPLVIRLAEDGNYFTFLKLCAERCNIVSGDGRLRIANAPNNSYGVIFLDAFTSDAVPVHLLTVEAITLYLSKLKKGGFLVFNVSNNFLSFPDLLAPLAKQLNLDAVIRDDVDLSLDDLTKGRFASHYIVLGRDSGFLDQLVENFGWRKLRAENPVLPWRDHYSNILSIMR